METPKEIYIFSSIDDKNKPGCIWNDTPDAREDVESVKYIRSDLAELTWEDIRLILVEYHLLLGEGKLPGNEDFYRTLLSRFNYSKNK